MVYFQQTLHKACFILARFMTRIFAILIIISLSGELAAQVRFRAVVSQSPVIVGESFRVQYIIENAETIQNFTPPSFSEFRVVNGPEIYYGQSESSGLPHSLKNMIYTLQAEKAGRYLLKGAAVLIDGKTMRCNDVQVEVIDNDVSVKQYRPGEFLNDSYTYLKPGEDPYEKIRKNLFLKVMLDKKSCYAGEPVVATFKLYSRLQSRSDIVKNPGFYGFTVHDMINLDDKMVAVESVNGQLFDVHTIRKVQLYPLQAGDYVVDAMEVRNKVEFSRSVVNKKAEQEIIEGIFDEEEKKPLEGIEVFEASISTAPVAIRVKPLPMKNRPEEFNGATGQFHISASLENNEIARNQEGYLLISIEGAGNFNQLVAPVIQWPEGIEGFEPAIIDKLDKLQVPLAGSRTFRYPFVAANAAQYNFSPVSFSFFDPDSNRFKKKVTETLSVTIRNREKSAPVAPKKIESLDAINRRTSLLAACILVLLVTSVLAWWLWKNKKPKQVAHIIEPKLPTLPSADELLRPAFMLIPAADREFYGNLYRSVYDWLGKRFELSGTQMNKQTLVAHLQATGMPDGEALRLLQLLSLFETGKFTNVSLEVEREELLRELKRLLDQLAN